MPLPCGRWRRSTATRASSPARAGSTALPSRPTPKAEKTCRKGGSGGGSAWWMVRFQAHARASTESRLSRTRDDDPPPADEVERVVDGVPVGPAPPQGEDREHERREDERPRAQGSGRAPEARHAARPRRSRSLRRRARRSPRAVARCPATRSALRRRRLRRRAHRGAARLVGEEGLDRGDERGGVARRDRDGRLGRHDLAVALDVRSDDGRRARERAREHHPEALAAERRARRSAFVERSRSVSSSCERKPTMSMPSSDTAEPGQEQPDRERVGAGDDEPRTRSRRGSRATRGAARAGPCAARAVRRRPPCARDRRGRPGRGSGRRSGRPPTAPPSHRSAEARARSRDGDPLVDPVHQEAPGRHPEPHPAEVARRVVRRDDGRRREREGGDADRGSHRLVEVQHVEPLPLEHPPDRGRPTAG